MYRQLLQKMLEIFISLQDHTGYFLSTAKLKLSVLCLAPNYFESLKENGCNLKKKLSRYTCEERQVAFLTWRNTYSAEKVYYLPALSEVKQKAGSSIIVSIIWYRKRLEEKK